MTNDEKINLLFDIKYLENSLEQCKKTIKDHNEIISFLNNIHSLSIYEYDEYSNIKRAYGLINKFMILISDDEYIYNESIVKKYSLFYDENKKVYFSKPLSRKECQDILKEFIINSKENIEKSINNFKEKIKTLNMKIEKTENILKEKNKILAENNIVLDL